MHEEARHTDCLPSGREELSAPEDGLAALLHRRKVLSSWMPATRDHNVPAGWGGVEVCRIVIREMGVVWDDVEARWGWCGVRMRWV